MPLTLKRETTLSYQIYELEQNFMPLLPLSRGESEYEQVLQFMYEIREIAHLENLPSYTAAVKTLESWCRRYSLKHSLLQVIEQHKETIIPYLIQNSQGITAEEEFFQKQNLSLFFKGKISEVIGRTK